MATAAWSRSYRQWFYHYEKYMRCCRLSAILCELHAGVVHHIVRSRKTIFTIIFYSHKPTRVTNQISCALTDYRPFSTPTLMPVVCVYAGFFPYLNLFSWEILGEHWYQCIGTTSPRSKLYKVAKPRSMVAVMSIHSCLAQ